MTLNSTSSSYGLALLNKPKGKSSFHLVSILRKLTQIRCIGHAGTLDPFATGLMVMLVGRTYTKRADEFLHGTKEYIAKVRLGESTDTYDSDGEIQKTSPLLPTLSELELALKEFQGQILQIPPMYSAKKVNGKRLYELARKGIEIERAAKSVCVETTLLDYTYPYLELHVRCSGGTYIRSIAHDLGLKLGCFAHLETLERTQVGPFNLKDAQNPLELTESNPLILRQNW